MHSPLWSVARSALFLAGLLGPGAVLAWALRAPRWISLWLVGSWVSIYALVIVFTCTAIPVSLGTLSAGLAVIAMGAAWLRGRGATQATSAPSESATANGPWRELVAPFVEMGPWTPVYVLLWVILIVRALQEPLAGPDIGFRWSHLAEQLLRHGSLDFYPPRLPEHFVSYFWVESIPPGVSSVLAWTYACAESADGRWTILPVLLQVWAVHDLVWRAATRLGGRAAARFACIALAAAPLLTWSLLLGQESGFTTIAVIGIVAASLEWSQSGHTRWIVFAVLFAMLGASAREYGLLFFALLAAALVTATRWLVCARPERAETGRRAAWLGFSLALAASLVWPLRVALLTGSPLYSLPVWPLPTNAIFAAWIEFSAETFGGTLHSAEGWRDVARYLGLYAPAATLGIGVVIVAAIRGTRGARTLAGMVAVVFALWASSVAYTNGGLFYAMRVTGPALAPGALVIGCALARIHAKTVATAVLGLTCLLALPASLALPNNPWRTDWRSWPILVRQTWAPEAILPSIRATGTRAIIADAPGFQSLLAADGITAVPPWSPQADWLIDARLSDAEAVQRWRTSGLRYVLVTKNPVNRSFFREYARGFRPPFKVTMVAESDSRLLLRIDVCE